MLKMFLIPAISTLVLYFINSFFLKKRESSYTYITFFSVLFFIQLIFYGVKLNASESIKVNNYFMMHNNLTNFSKNRIKEEIKYLEEIKCLTETQRNEFQKKYDYHLNEGHRCFNEAHKLCRMIPDADEEEMAEKLFQITISTAAGYGVGGYPGVISVLVAHLGDYLVNSYKEYRKMKSLLNESKYHYEMCEFYKNILDTQ